jgi:hypothetical protein
VNRFIDCLQVVTTENYNVIVVYTIYSSHFVNRFFLVTAPAMAIPLPPG